jgi:predicted nucleic acid-binding protein
MILVDSSVWIDYLRNIDTAQTARLDSWLGQRPIAIGDLMLAEVLQGIPTDRDFDMARQLFSAFPVITIGGETAALQAAQNYRRLRALGVTVRKTIDTLIATRCIADGHSLLFSDRDFDPFVAHLGLIDAMED